MVWPDNVENDGQRKTAVNNWRQSPEARKAKKSSVDAATDGDFDASVLRNDVARPDNVEDDGQKESAVIN